MFMLRRILKPVSLYLALTMALMSVPFGVANAAMVGTEAVIGAEQAQAAREKVQNFLQREDVQKALQSQGINASEAVSRVNSLTDVEVADIAGKLDQLPAGGDALGELVSAGVFVFIILLITDLLGLTNVFPFVKHHR